MANVLGPITILALLGGSLLYGENELRKQQSPVQPISAEQNSDQSARVWLFSNDTNHDICLITKTRHIRGSTYQIEVEPTCEGVFAASDELKVWNEDEQGNVRLINERGNTIVEFIAGSEYGLSTTGGRPEIFYLTPSS